jgi:hypothetical protein
MRSYAKYAVLGLLLAAGLASPAAAQLAFRCDVFQRDALGAWNATEPVTVDTHMGLVDIMPGHHVSTTVARILDRECP